MNFDWPWQSGILDPQGPIGAAERTILLNATSIMLAVIVPVIVLTLAFAWWFRATNRRATYLPDWEYSGHIELVVWAIPALIVLFLGGICWIGTHDLDPRKPISAEAKPLEIDVVSLDWKWLFLYRAEGVASVNKLVVPAGMPLHFRLTSATVMNSFVVPQLGSQIYTMAGMTTQLHLQADKPGTYPGISAQFSGRDFSDMRFDLVAVSPADFTAWVAQARRAKDALDEPGYAALAKPGSATPATFKSVAPHLFETIAMGKH